MAFVAVTAVNGLSQTETNERCPLQAPLPESSPAVTPAEICATIAVLAADSLEGREAGSPGADLAAAYIAGRFAAAGLSPPEGGFLQRFTFPAALRHDPHAAESVHVNGPGVLPPGPGSGTLATANIVGILRGSDRELSREAVVIGAHYDHLGYGGPGSLAPGVRAIHNGADDNASGVAGLLELAERFVADPPARTLLFVAFGAEEPGIVGSLHYVEHPVWPLEATVAMVNLDMIGRLRETLTVYGTGTSPAWPAILDSLPEPEGFRLSRVPDGFGPSDHAAFYGAQVPVLAYFTGAHEEYHRPGDDLTTIDPTGSVRVIEHVASVVERVAGGDREIRYAEAPATERRAMAFSVGLGIIPDYAFAGPGLRVSSIRPGGPADRAGLATDDVLLELGGHPIGDVYAYTAILADLEADVPVDLVYRRAGDERRVTLAPEAR
ncbi:M20/M25/M40 family metallo-hydrolase [soil metagenome]